MDLAVLVRVVTFAASMIVAAILLKVTIRHLREPTDVDTYMPRTTVAAIFSYAFLVLYVAVNQTAHHFSEPLTYRLAFGQVGVLLGAYAGLRDYVRIDLPAAKARRAKRKRTAMTTSTPQDTQQEKTPERSQSAERQDETPSASKVWPPQTETK